MGFFLFKNHWVIAVEQFRKNSFSSGMLATLPLPPSLCYFYNTLYTFAQKIKFLE